MSDGVIPIAKPFIGPEEKEAVMRVLDSGMLASGPRTREFEAAFAQFVRTRHALAVNSGTAALHAALLAAGIGPGDEVVTTPFTFVATANMILLAGATPVFADINPDTYNIDPESVAQRITRRTKAILPVHLFGLPADMRRILQLGRDHGLKVIEDACQAHGASYHGQPVGSIGDAGTFSFYPTKNMTVGEGGAITTNDDGIAAAADAYRNQGREPNATLGTYNHSRLGHNYRWSDINAAIGLVQLSRLPAFTSKRRENAVRLTRELSGYVQTPIEPPGLESSYHQYTIRVSHRESFLRKLKAQGVGAGVYYPTVLYRYPHLAKHVSACPHAEQASAEVVALPVHPHLGPKDLQIIIAAVRNSV